MTTQEKINALSPDQQRVWGALVMNEGLTMVQAYEKVIKMDIYADLPNEKLPKR